MTRSEPSERAEASDAGQLGQEGRLLAARYRLLAVLGRGGMGTVWRARDEMLDREVAVKEVLVRGELSDDERAKMRERTLREARATARLNHPGIVTVHDVVDEDDRPWIVMELVRSRSLQEVVEAEGPLPPDRVARIGRQMVAALRAAHAVGILHRDVKPANVLITTPSGTDMGTDTGTDTGPSGRVVLTDFGIAQTAGDSALTQTGLLVGSPAYLPPERARGERATPASDLWAVGATLYAAVEGRPPHQRSDVMAMLAAVMTEDPPPPRNAGPLTPVLGGLLLRDPAQRLSAAQAEELLEQVAGGGATQDRQLRTASFAQPAPPAPQAPTDQSSTPYPSAPYPPASYPPVSYPASSYQPAPASPAPPSSAPGHYTTAPGTPDARTSVVPFGPAGARFAPHGSPPQDRRGPNVGLLVLIGALVTSVAVLAAVLVLRPDDGKATPPTGPSANAGASQQSTPSAGQTTPAAGQSTTPSAGPSVPPGLRLDRGPGYTIAVPVGWTRSEEGNSVFWRDPASAAYLQVDRTLWAGDPTAHWEQWESEVRAKNALENYERVDLRTPQGLGYSAADLEFTWRNKAGVPMRAIDRGVQANGRPYAVFVAIPADQWAESLNRVNNILGSFRP